MTNIFSAHKEVIHQKLFLLLSALVVLTMPFSVRLNSYAMVLLSINWVLEGNWKQGLQPVKENKYALLLIGFYILHIIGLLHSANMRQGFFELEKKAAFVLYPVIFTTTPYLDKQRIQKILDYFVTGCTLAAMICLTYGLYIYNTTGDSSFLFYHPLTSVIHFDHAIYFSLYVGFCLFIVLYKLTTINNQQTFGTKLAYAVMIVFFIVFLILLSSKTLLVSIFLLLIFFFVRIIFLRKGVFLSSIAGLALMLFFIAAIITIPNVRNRFTEVLIDQYEQTNVLKLDDYQGYHFTGANMRLAIWKIVVEEIEKEKAYLLGTGTGDSQDILTNAYIRKHVYPGDKALGFVGFLHYNAHNQFFQNYLMFGVIGVLFLIAILGYLIFLAVHCRKPILFSMILIFCSFSLTESTLQVQKGIVFFAFFSSLLTTPKSITRKKEV